MQMNYAINGSTLEVNLMGKITFSNNEDFKKILDIIRKEELDHVTFHMGQVEFVDSAALGMLLLARDEAEKKSLDVTLREAKGQPQKMFEVSNFHKLFTIK